MSFTQRPTIAARKSPGQSPPARCSATALRLLDAGEYQRLVANLAGRERISVGTLAQYAERRNLKLNEVLAGIIN